MTATFGKLDHETLTLQPGLNVIEAPNEWGKSTWCAFLVNMLYGIDTRAKTTKTALAEKERYAPWSGLPMSGRIDLNWNGRDITIERKTKGRLIFGDFRAYETESGLEVQELNSANCGQMLLGVERSVFTRAGFLRQTELPVTQDEALRRRLNNLVTTGDESGAGDKLEQKLRELKNKCRYNRTGLLPQAEAQRDKLEQQIYELQDLDNRVMKTKARLQELDAWTKKLENHKQALSYEQSREDVRRVQQAQADREQAAQTVSRLEAVCGQLPSQEVAERAVQTAQALQEQWMSAQMEVKMLPQLPVQGDIPDRYLNKTGQQAVEEAEEDTRQLNRLLGVKKKYETIRWAILALGIAALAAVLLGLQVLGTAAVIAICAGVCAVTVAAVAVLTGKARQTQIQMHQLYLRHAPLEAALWAADARDFAARQSRFEEEKQRITALRADADAGMQALEQKIQAFAGEKTLGQCREEWDGIAAQWKRLGDARRDLQRADAHAKALQEMVREAPPAQFADELDYTAGETDTMLTNARLEQKQSQLRLGQLQGQAEALGQEEPLRQQLRKVKQRIAQLEDYYRALEMAQNALQAATSELQRRFAPRISKRAQALFGKLTGSRYNRLTLSEDLSLQVGAESEDTLRAAQWRSDGTVDQLYLALRLAVAEELTPEAPLILDDALVRFDDARLAAAMEILKECAENKQVILFTCQSREKRYVNG